MVDTGLGHTGEDTQGSLGHMGGHAAQPGPHARGHSTPWAETLPESSLLPEVPGGTAVHLARLSWCIVALSPCLVPPVLLPEEVMSFQPLLSAWWPAAPAQTWVQEPCGAGSREGHFSAWLQERQPYLMPGHAHNPEHSGVTGFWRPDSFIWVRSWECTSKGHHQLALWP